MQNGWIQEGRIQDRCHHYVNQMEWVWIRVRLEEECFWVNLREDNNVFESKMAEPKMVEFKMAAIIKLSQNEWVKFFLCKWWEPILASVPVKFESEWKVSMVESKMASNSRWQNSRWLPSSSWVRMNEFESDWISWSQSKNGVTVFLSEFWEKITRWSESKIARIQDGCHHQGESEWVSEVIFCVNVGNQSWQVWVSLREKTKMVESKMAKFKMAEFKMAAIIKLSENEWSLSQMVGTNLGKCESVWEDKLLCKMAKFKNGSIQDGCHHLC